MIDSIFRDGDTRCSIKFWKWNKHPCTNFHRRHKRVCYKKNHMEFFFHQCNDLCMSSIENSHYLYVIKQLHLRFQKWFLFYFFNSIFSIAWDEEPTTAKTLVYSVKEAEMPTVTLCPENSNPDRWGPTIKIFDYLERKCFPKRYI